MTTPPETVQAARVSGCNAIIVAGVGAVAAILTALLGSEPLKVAIGSVSWPRREAALNEQVRQLTEERDGVRTELANTSNDFRALRIKTAELERQIHQLADARQLPAPRMSATYFKYDSKKTDCLLAGAAALRLATRLEPKSISDGALFVEVGSYKAVVMCFSNDELAFISCMGPSGDEAGKIYTKVTTEFKNVAGIK
jgi:hypothetical protein